MEAIIICTTGGDALAKISLTTYKCEKINYTLSEIPVGPHGIRSYKDKIITANSDSNSVSFFNKIKLAEYKNIKIGPRPNDLLMEDEQLFTICGESNSLVVYDINAEKVICETTTGSWPHSLDICRSKTKIFVSNLEGNSLSVISLDNYDRINTIPACEYPTKIKVSNNEKFIYVCESYLGTDECGYLEIFSAKTLVSLARIKVGYAPVDLFEDNINIYITNFTDGSISVINKDKMKVVKTIQVGGMPKSIVIDGEKIFVADYLKNRIIVIDKERIKKVIAIESEPNAMTLF